MCGKKYTDFIWCNHRSTEMYTRASFLCVQGPLKIVWKIGYEYQKKISHGPSNKLVALFMLCIRIVQTKLKLKAIFFLHYTFGTHFYVDQYGLQLIVELAKQCDTSLDPVILRLVRR